MTSSPTFQRFDTADVLHLWIERDPDPEAGELVNLIENPDGAPVPGQGVPSGAWGWVSPLPLQVGISATIVDGDYYLKLSPVTGQNNYVWTEPQPIEPTWDIAASYDSYHDPDEPGAHFTRGRIQFLDEDLDVIGSTPVMGWDPNGSHEIPAVAIGDIAPDAVYARLAINIAKNNDGDDVTNPSADLLIRNVKLIQSGDPADLVHPLPDVPSHYMEDVIELAQGISVNRVPLDANTMSLTLMAEGASEPDESTGGYGTEPYGLTFYGGGGGGSEVIALDGSSLRPGKNVRLVAQVGVGLYAVRNLFTGEVSQGRVDYDLTQPEGRRAKITLTVVDAAAKLAAKSYRKVYADPWYARAYFEGTGVPWYVKFSSALPLGVATVATTDGSVLDQLIKTRDSNPDFRFWVDVNGVLQGYELDDVPSYLPPGTQLTDDIYNGSLVASYDTDRVVNSVKVTVLNGTESKDFGPYERPRSIGKWGRRTGTYTIVPTDDHPFPGWGDDAADKASARAAARNLLDRLAEPALVIESATLPILSTQVPAWDFGSIHWATLDLYQRITVTNESPAFSYDLEVVGIKHDISHKKWLTTYTFGAPNRPALPTR